MSAAVIVKNLVVTHRAGRGAAATTVLHNVSCSVAPGECLAIIGVSGSGKSVFARTLLGLTSPHAEIMITGRPLGEQTPKNAHKLLAAGASGSNWQASASHLQIAGHNMLNAKPRAWRDIRGGTIALALQDALQSLDPLRTIGAEVAETLAINRVPRGQRRQLVVAALKAAGLAEAENLLQLRAAELSGGMRQRALVAAAMVAKPRVLVADEPTAALDAANAQVLLDEFARVRDSGTALILISHDLSLVEKIADRVQVVAAGRFVESGSRDEVCKTPQHPVTRSLLLAAATAGSYACAPQEKPFATPGSQAAPLLEMREVTKVFSNRSGTPRGVVEVSLSLRAGEVLGVGGESGAGKSTLARLLAGQDTPDSGTIARAAGARVRLIPQDPLASFDPRLTVSQLLIDSLQRANARKKLSPQLAGKQAACLLAKVGLPSQMLSRFPASLSGGERQRVAIARALAAQPAVLVCDEILSALDTVAQASILQLLTKLRQQVAMIFISHSTAHLAMLCDRTIILRRGRVSKV